MHPGSAVNVGVGGNGCGTVTGTIGTIIVGGAADGARDANTITVIIMAINTPNTILKRCQRFIYYSRKKSLLEFIVENEISSSCGHFVLLIHQILFLTFDATSSCGVCACKK